MNHPTPDDQVTAQANAYYWLTRMRDWISAANPADEIWETMCSPGILVKVNDISTLLYCDGSGNRAGSNCPGFSRDQLRLFSPPDCTYGCTGICPNKSNATIITHETGHIDAGETWYFQGWYRDPMGPCGTAFNLSNAIAVTFAP